MLKKWMTIAALCGAMATPAIAGQGQAGNGGATLLPPPGYQGQWWTSPNNCEYSRAGRPGETVWYLIVNTAHSGCAARLIERAYSDYK